MTAPATITVLVVDDDAFVRRGITDIFAATNDIRVVAGVDDGDRVPGAVNTYRPHVVLMDLKMQRVGGLEATRQLMTHPRPPRVIAMTAMDVDDLVVQAVAAGAHSFVSKDEAPSTFHMSVRAVASGNTLFSQDALRRIAQSGPATAEPPVSAVMSSLTQREREVLCIMASGATTSTISKQLFLSETTVKTHITAIFTKLGVGNRVEAALSAFRAGWVT